MPLSRDEYNLFIDLINFTEGKNEVACGKYLPHAAILLCRRTPRQVIQVVQEDRTHYGNSDCIVVADTDNGRGKTERCAFLWEVKAPQCALMKLDGHSTRCTPTDDLLKAENQLIHYANELQGNEAFRERHGIIHRENIILGGIIIGRDGKLSTDRSDPANEVHADRSLTVRERYIYAKANFLIWTWDEIARFLKPED